MPDFSDVKYELCALCDHFIDENDIGGDPDLAAFIHLEEGEQAFDHDATPSGEIHTGDEWNHLRPDLFIEHPDSRVGPNSIHHSRRGKVDKHGLLTPEQKAEYVKDSGHCPFCGSEEIQGERTEHLEGDPTQEITCLHCSRRWRDVYKLAHIEEV